MSTSKNFESDPKLKKLRLKIEKILKDNDVAGIVFLSSRTHNEWLFQGEASWSQIKVLKKDPNGMATVSLQIRKDKPKEMNATAGMVFAFRDLCRDWYSNLNHWCNGLELNGQVTHQGITVNPPPQGTPIQ